MSLELLTELAWKSLLGAGATLLILSLLKRRSAAERSWVAHLGLLATALLPLTTYLLRGWQISPPVEFSERVLSPLGYSINMEAGAAAVPIALGQEQSPSPQIALDAVAVWLYSVPSLFLIILTILGVARLGLLRRRAAVLAEQDWLTALARAQIRMNFKHGTALLVSNDVSSPISWGFFRPVILLDQKVADEGTQAEAIIAHELAHVTRLDWAKLILGRVVTAMYWFNPLVWMLARQCHELREEAADDAVLRSSVGRADYADLLVGAARHENKGLLLAANGVAPAPGSLARRVSRILDAKLSRRPARLLFQSGSFLSVALVAAPLSALALSENPAEHEAARQTAIPALPPAPGPVPPPLAALEGEQPAVTALTEAELAALATKLESGKAMRLHQFKSLELRGGGSVIVRPGKLSSIELVRGGGSGARVALDAAGRLYVLGCTRCKNADVQITISTPALERLTIEGGGSVTVARGFAPVGEVSGDVRGRGTLDLRGLNPQKASVAVKGDGEILVRPRAELMAAILGRGEITYWGNPAVSSAVMGGGSLKRGGAT